MIKIDENWVTQESITNDLRKPQKHYQFIGNRVKKNFEFVTNFTPLDILLGIPNFDKNVEIDILNFVILFAKFFIHNCKKYNAPIALYPFLVKLKTYVTVQEYKCKIYNNALQEFERKWSG